MHSESSTGFWSLWSLNIPASFSAYLALLHFWDLTISTTLPFSVFSSCFVSEPSHHISNPESGQHCFPVSRSPFPGLRIKEETHLTASLRSIRDTYDLGHPWTDSQRPFPRYLLPDSLSQSLSPLLGPPPPPAAFCIPQTPNGYGTSNHLHSDQQAGSIFSHPKEKIKQSPQRSFLHLAGSDTITFSAFLPPQTS